MIDVFANIQTYSYDEILTIRDNYRNEENNHMQYYLTCNTDGSIKQIDEKKFKNLIITKFTSINNTPQYILLDRSIMQSLINLSFIPFSEMWYDEFNKTCVNGISKYFFEYYDDHGYKYAFASNNITVLNAMHKSMLSTQE